MLRTSGGGKLCDLATMQQKVSIQQRVDGGPGGLAAGAPDDHRQRPVRAPVRAPDAGVRRRRLDEPRRQNCRGAYRGESRMQRSSVECISCDMSCGYLGTQEPVFAGSQSAHQSTRIRVGLGPGTQPRRQAVCCLSLLLALGCGTCIYWLSLVPVGEKGNCKGSDHWAQDHDGRGGGAQHEGVLLVCARRQGARIFCTSSSKNPTKCLKLARSPSTAAAAWSPSSAH
jgi:hypothetical protein